MKMFEIRFKDFHSVIIFADSIAAAKAKCPDAIFIHEVIIH